MTSSDCPTPDHPTPGGVAHASTGHDHDPNTADSADSADSAHEGHGGQPRDRQERRPPLPRDRAAAADRVPDHRGRRRFRHRLPGAAVRRRAHALRHRRDRRITVGDPARRPPRGRGMDLRLETRRDPLRRQQRHHPAGRVQHRDLRIHPTPRPPADGRRRPGAGRRDHRRRRQHPRRVGAGQSQPVQPQRAGRLPAHPHRSLRVHRRSPGEAAAPEADPSQFATAVVLCPRNRTSCGCSG